MPGDTKLTRASRQSQDELAVNAVALQARLESLSSVPAAGPSLPSPSPSPSSTAPTTPPDHENDLKRGHLLEEQARHLLEQDGCPPCCPSDTLFPVRNPPEQYRGIILYWDTFPSSEGGVLCAQREDWYRFRSFQEKNRRYYKQRFARFTNAVRERRMRHHLSEAVGPRSNPEDQTRVETWVEFQDYHLHAHEDFEGKVEGESQRLHAVTENLQSLVGSELELAARCQEAYSVRLASAIQKVELHKKHLLPWIERQRIQMVAAQSAAINDTRGIRRTPVPGTLKRKPKVHSALAPVRSAVSKPNPRKRSLRIQRSKESRMPEDSAFSLSDSESSKSQMPHLRRKESQKTPLRPFCPQKVTKSVKKDRKSKRRADIDTPPRLSPRSREVEQWKPKQSERTSNLRPVHRHLTEHVVTKSGRTSRRPKRLGFISY